jgi:regulatory protein
MSPKTRSQLADAMAARGIPDAAAEAVLDRYTEVGLINDTAFAQAWVTTRQAGRGLATRALAQELHRKGIDKDIAGQALATLDPATEEDAARALVQRRLRSMANLEPHVATRRLLGMLARKGYPSGVSLRVVRDGLSQERERRDV